MTRSEILKRANEIINGERQDRYGNAENNFDLIGDLWSAYLGKDIIATDVAHMMTLFKIARAKTGVGDADSYIDAVGYMAIGGEIAEKDRKTAEEADNMTDEDRVKYLKSIFGDAYNPPKTITRDEAKERAEKLGKGAVLIHKREDGIIINVLWTGMTTVCLSDEKRPDFIAKHMAFADIDEAIEYYDKHRKKPHGLDNLLKLTSICAKLRKVTEEMEDMGVREKVEDPDDIGKILYSATINGIQMTYWSSGTVSVVDTTESDPEEITGYMADSIAGARADMIDDINEGDRRQRDRTIHIYDTFMTFCKTLMEEGLIKESQMGEENREGEDDED